MVEAVPLVNGEEVFVEAQAKCLVLTAAVRAIKAIVSGSEDLDELFDELFESQE